MVRSRITILTGIAALLAAQEANAADLSWKSYTWAVTDGGMAGVAEGSPDNVSVDADGYLHLHIRKNGSTWTAAELFTTEKLGFGTYQWQTDGPIDTFDKNVVLGLFPYGPAAGIGDDGTNEIDIEYSRWGQANGPNGDYTNYPASGTTIGEHTYTFSLDGGTLATSRFVWRTDSIEDFLLSGLQPPTSTAELLQTWKYAPPDPETNIPQQALPLGINLWCFDIPSDGQDVEIVIRDFQFIAEGTDPAGGTGGMGGTAGTGGRGSAGDSAGGATARGGAGALSGASTTGGRSAAGGEPSNGGRTSEGGASDEAGAPNGGMAPLGASGGMTSTAGRSVGGRSAGGAPANGGAPASAGAPATAANATEKEASGCGCTVADRGSPSGLGWLFALLLVRARRRSALATR